MSFTWSFTHDDFTTTLATCTNPPAERMDLFAATCVLVFWVFEAVHFQRWEGFFWATDHLSWIWGNAPEMLVLQNMLWTFEDSWKPNNIVNTTHKIVMTSQIQ